MTCLVCGQEFDRDDFCNRCGFPVTLFTDASPEAAQQERERANEYINKILTDASMSLISYTYTPENGKFVLSKKETHSIGAVQNLFGSPMWLTPQITNINEGTLSVEAECTFNEHTRPIKVQLKAESSDPMFTLGLQVGRDFLLSVILKDSNGILDEQKVEFLSF